MNLAKFETKLPKVYNFYVKFGKRKNILKNFCLSLKLFLSPTAMINTLLKFIELARPTDMGVGRGGGMSPPGFSYMMLLMYFLSRVRLIGAISRSWFFHCPPPPPEKIFSRRPCLQTNQVT